MRFTPYRIHAKSPIEKLDRLLSCIYKIEGFESFFEVKNKRKDGLIRSTKKVTKSILLAKINML